MISRICLKFAAAFISYCVMGIDAPVAHSQVTSYPGVTHPTLQIEFGSITSTDAPSGPPSITPSGISFTPTLGPFDGNPFTMVSFLVRHPKGIKSVMYEVSGGYSFGDFASEKVVSEAYFRTEVWDVNGTPITGPINGAATFIIKVVNIFGSHGDAG